MRHSLRLPAALFGLLIGVGIAHGQSGREDRINRAIPLSVDAQNALEEMRHVIGPGALRSTIEDELRTKLQLRALQCSQDYTLPAELSDDQIRRLHGGDPCFAQNDAMLATWLGLHSAGVLLAESPLRAIVANLPNEITDQQAPINLVRFAARAGVALVASWRDIEVLDLGLGVPVHTGPRSADEVIASLSPNGRLYTTQHDGSVHIYDAETGQLLAAPGWWGAVHWLDSRSALVFPADRHLPVIHDFYSGTDTALDGNAEEVKRVIAIPAAASTFLAFRNSGLTKFQLSYPGGRPQVRVLQLYPIHLNLVADSNQMAAAGLGNVYLFNSDDHLYETTLDDLHTQVIDLGDLQVQRTVATHDPDRTLLMGYVRGANNTWSYYAYSSREHTLQSIDISRLPGRQLFYDSAEDSLFAMIGASLSAVRDLPLGDVVDKASLVSRVPEGSRAGPGAPMMVFPRFTRTPYVRPPAVAVAGPIAALAKDADIEGVGVLAPYAGRSGEGNPGRYLGSLGDTDIPMFQRSSAPAGSQATQPGGAVQITVQARARPLILVLSSYARVEWQLKLARGSRLVAVLLTGPFGSSVAGQGAAQVIAIGDAYSYVLGSPQYERLQDEVYTWTGKRISLFQCGLQADSFSVY